MYDQELRDHLLYLLQGGGAHIGFDEAVADLPTKLRGARPPNVPHTPWRLVEHMRIAQWDILEFCCNPRHRSPEFPDGYWPQGDAPRTPAAWDETLRQFRADRKAFESLIADPANDLFVAIPHGDG